MTEVVQGLLFQYSKKHGGAAVVGLIKQMPEDGAAASEYIRARL
jgi:hypothetical protein